jgi:hypothetical protein
MCCIRLLTSDWTGALEGTCLAPLVSRQANVKLASCLAVSSNSAGLKSQGSWAHHRCLSLCIQRSRLRTRIDRYWLLQVLAGEHCST